MQMVAFRAAAGASVSNQPPIVALSAPTNGTAYVSPATISLSASASDPDGTVANVSFYAGSQLIGSSSASPYTMTWSNVAAGTYTLTAVATDNLGATTTSAAISVTVTVTSTPVQLTFTASANDATVTSYTLNLFAAGTSTPAVATQNLGKPTVVNGQITVDISQVVVGLPPGTYDGTVTATGAGGSSTSAPSNTFTR
jgi:hypothetical protein